MPANELAKDGPTIAPTRRSISPQPPVLPSLSTDGPPKEPIKPAEKLVEKENPTEDKPPAVPESAPKSAPLEPGPEPEEVNMMHRFISCYEKYPPQKHFFGESASVLWFAVLGE